MKNEIWEDCEPVNLKPGDIIRYRFVNSRSEWDMHLWSSKEAVHRLGAVTVKTTCGSVCQSAQFQRLKGGIPKKTWKDVLWKDIRPGDEICRRGYGSSGEKFTVDHIGDRCCKEVGSETVHYRSLGPLITDFKWQRLEKPELPDDWYLCKYSGNPTEIIRYKIGEDMYDGPDSSFNRTGALKRYKILKRARFEELEES